jgi:Ras GTPase-activating protein 1
VKPDLLTDLASAEVYPFDDSFFGRPNCFQLLVGSAEFVLCCNTKDEADSWLSALALVVAVSGTGPSIDPARAVQLFGLEVSVKEVKGLASKAPEAYAVVSLNGIKYARTPTVTGKSNAVVWSEDFVFECGGFFTAYDSQKAL